MRLDGHPGKLGKPQWKDDPMRISVLIPVFNGSSFLETTLRSVASGLSTEDEIVVVDDHSNDTSVQLAQDVLANFPCHSQIALNNGKGACRARNHALTLSSGNWVQWLDADDLIPPSKWEHVLPLAENRALVGCPWRPFRESVPAGVFDDGRDWSLSPVHKAAEWLAEDRMMIPAAWFGERTLFESTVGWDESLLVNQDGEYFARVIRQSSKIHFTEATEVYYRRGLVDSTSSFTPEKADSLYRSTESMVATAIGLEDSPRMRQMASNRWQQFIYTTYPYCPDLLNQAERQLSTLPSPNLTNPLTVSKASRLFSFILGWKTLTRTRMLRKRIAS